MNERAIKRLEKQIAALEAQKRKIIRTAIARMKRAAAKKRRH